MSQHGKHFLSLQLMTAQHEVRNFFMKINTNWSKIYKKVHVIRNLHICDAIIHTKKPVKSF